MAKPNPFYNPDPVDGLSRGWFFRDPADHPFGPFDCREMAEDHMREHYRIYYGC